MMNLMSAASQSEVAFPQDATLNPVALNGSEAFSSLMAVRSNPEPWVREVHCSLESLRELRENWDSYGASSANQASIEMAKDFAKVIGSYVSARRPSVSLSPAGNAAFSWEMSNGKRNLDVEVLGTGQQRYAFIDDDDESADREGITFNPAVIANLLTQW